MQIERERRELWWAGGLALALLAALALVWWLLRGLQPLPAQALESAPPPAVETPAPAPEVAVARMLEPMTAPPEPSAVAATSAPPPPVALLPARGIAGRVRDREDRPVVGLRVEARLEAGARQRSLGSAVTDAHGAYAIQVDFAAELRELEQQAAGELGRTRERNARDDSARADLIRALEREAGARLRRPRVSVEAGAPGRGWARAGRELERRSPALLWIGLRLDQAAVVGGRVFHRTAPVAGALVQLFDDRWQLLDGSVTDLDGRYSMGVPAPGHFHLHARAKNLGASGNSGFSLGDAAPFPEIDLDIDGFEALRGKVVLPGGEPIRNLRVMALQYGLWQGERFNGRNADHSAIAQAEASGGLCASDTSTDRDGMFALEALQRGNFALRIPSLRDEALQPRGAYPTGGEEHVLELDVHLVVVELRDPWLRRRVDHERGAADPVEFLCRPEQPDAEKAYRAGDLEYAADTTLGATFVVEPDRTYVVSALTRDGSARERVTVHQRERVKRVRLELGERDEELVALFDVARDEPGLLELSLRGPEDEALGELRVRALRLNDGKQLELRARNRTGVALAPGAYALEIEALAQTGSRRESEQASELVPQRHEFVRVTSGATTRIAGRFERGGRLRISLAEPDQTSPTFPRRWTRGSGLSIDRFGSVALLTPLAAGAGAARELAWECAGQRVASLLPGETGRSNPIQPGAYRLELRARGFAPITRELEIRAGELTELQLEPQLAQD